MIAKPNSLDALPSWKDCLAQSITSIEELNHFFPVDETSIRTVIERYPMRINPYYLGLIKKKGDPLYLQAVPDEREISDVAGEEDPLAEEACPLSPASHTVIRTACYSWFPAVAPCIVGFAIERERLAGLAW